MEYFQSVLKEAQETCYKKTPEIKSKERKAFVEACELFQEAVQAKQAVENQKDLEKLEKNQQKAMKKCVKAASKIFKDLDISAAEGLEGAILKGYCIIQATPEGLAKFVEEDEKIHTKLIKTLLKTPSLIKEMLIHGGPKHGMFGQAMKIYTQILAQFPEEEDKFTPINKKIALAVALELCFPMTEFDTKIVVDPVKRYKHYEKAHRNGELDPAFPHFSVWELRHVINCDAKNDQLQWIRDCLMNYAPYIAAITDIKQRYLYILDTDVLQRDPSWTDSPRTYQQVLSGGGRDAPNAWFGRFILKAFGLPTWGCKQPGRNSLTRWTPTGWEAMLGANWDTCSWEGVSGVDFKAEVDARCGHSTDEYYKKLILIEGLAEVQDSRRADIPEEEKTMLHPLRLWRSLSIIQKALMLEPASPEKFERSGPGLVKTRVETYIEEFELDKPEGEIGLNDKGILKIPASAHGFTSGNLMVISSYGGGRQLNFLADGKVEYELPVGIEEKTYILSLDVCTVHLKQAPLLLQVDEGEPITIKVPYTVGEWITTHACRVNVSEGSILRFSRERPCFGLAIKNISLH